MGRTASFSADAFLAAARAVAAETGPGAVTIGSVTARLGAPTGSFYHRFRSRDALLGALWLDAAQRFQGEFLALVDLGDGLSAALSVPTWVRAHPEDARLLLLHHRDEFAAAAWPAAIRNGVKAQARTVEACLEGFARRQFGSATPATLRRAQFALIDLPIAAVRPHLMRREAIPPVVEALISEAYAAVIAAGPRPRGGR